MKIYLVGGAVRDEHLSRPIKERDWVVVGATPEQMLKQGYQQVGKQFPVFLHPKTKEEYALARSEIKTDKGYQGFEFNTSTNITLEEDLIRRDITINAMAKDSQNNLIDPYNGLKDLKNRILRHVSPAFQEDPVRLLRVARFLSRFKQYDFTIAKETWELLNAMVNNGEVDALVPERVWKEWERALSEPNPECFIDTLVQCQAWPRIIEEFPQASKQQNQLTTLVNLTTNPIIRFAGSIQDLAQESKTPSKDLKQQVKALCTRLHIPNSHRELAELSVQFTHQIAQASTLSPQQFLSLFQAIDIFRKPERLDDLLILSQALQITQNQSEQHIKENTNIWKTLHQKISQINIEQLMSKGLSGKDLGQEINNQRLKIMTDYAQHKLPTA